MNIKYCLLFFVFFFFNCKSDKKKKIEVFDTFQRNQFNGFWMIDSASVNGIDTKSLHGLFFDISENSNYSNLTGDTLKDQIQITDLKFLNFEGKNPKSFKVDLLSDSMMYLTTQIANQAYQIKMKKRNKK